MYIRLKEGKPFAFAGLWEVWHPGDEAIQSCTIITTAPNQMMSTIHDRMPVILPPMAWEHWLEPDDQPASLLDPFLRPYPASEMEAYPVSKFVNSPTNDNAGCIQPAA
jgi:putative SOS response-associated peptidase YedK